MIIRFGGHKECVQDVVQEFLTMFGPTTDFEISFISDKSTHAETCTAKRPSGLFANGDAVEVKRVSLSDEDIKVLRGKTCTCKKLMYGKYHAKVCGQYLLNQFVTESGGNLFA